MPEVNPILKSLELLFVKDVKEGKTTYETRRLRNIKVTATPDDLLALSDGIVAISEGTFFETQSTVTSKVAPAI